MALATIVEAAAILREIHPEIELKMIGDGQTADAIEKQITSLKLDNITWERKLVSGRELRSDVEQSHCILGVFGRVRQGWQRYTLQSVSGHGIK